MVVVVVVEECDKIGGRSRGEKRARPENDMGDCGSMAVFTGTLIHQSLLASGGWKGGGMALWADPLRICTPSHSRQVECKSSFTDTSRNMEYLIIFDSAYPGAHPGACNREEPVVISSPGQWLFQPAQKPSQLPGPPRTNCISFISALVSPTLE